MLMLNLLTFFTLQTAPYMLVQRKTFTVKGFLFNAEQGEPQGIKAHHSREAQAFPPYTVIMVIVNKSMHYLHTFPTIPLGEADQCQHAATPIQKKGDKRRVSHLNTRTAALHFKTCAPCVHGTVHFYQLNKVEGSKRGTQQTDNCKMMHVWRRAHST